MRSVDNALAESEPGYRRRKRGMPAAVRLLLLSCAIGLAVAVAALPSAAALADLITRA
ncbi:hypothetical protein [Actinokineospora inagensis]|uniref:hypothetical protein n=1 Tax=Actinokineospora inagensis TaxID=103730 RepID=UPI00041BBB64|nr:hypothetical protein [Actinokineospora inagensis]